MKVKKKSSRAKINDMEAALNFFAEAGLLKKIKRSGWWVTGLDFPESVAEHSFRTTVIAFYLAYLEGTDPSKTALMALFNDIHEARINDLHKMGHYYIDFKDAEKKVFKDQIQNLDVVVKNKLKELREEYDGQRSRESILARDADILECLLQAKEYYDAGHLKTRYFFSKAATFLKTKSARRLWQQIKKWNSGDWWQNVVKFER